MGNPIGTQPCKGPINSYKTAIRSDHVDFWVWVCYQVGPWFAHRLYTWGSIRGALYMGLYS